MQFSLHCTLCCLTVITGVTALTNWSAPDCQESWVADGVKDYDAIAQMFFPEAEYGGFNYRWHIPCIYRCQALLLLLLLLLPNI